MQKKKTKLTKKAATETNNKEIKLKPNEKDKKKKKNPQMKTNLAFQEWRVATDDY